MGSIMTTGSSGLTPTQQTYFDRVLLEHAVQLTILDQFAQKRPLPKNKGTKTIRYFRPPQADVSQVQTLTEGTTPSARRDLTMEYVEATLVQYGEVAETTDILNATGLFDFLEIATVAMGEDCALKMDSLMRDLLAKVAGNPVGLTRRYAQHIANWATLAANTSATATKLTINDVQDMQAFLTIRRAPKVNGSFAAVVCPQVSRDLLDDDKFVTANKYQNARKLFKNELGELYGVRFVEHTNPFIESSAGAEDTYNAAGDIFTTHVLGGSSFGMAEMAGMSPWSPRVLVTPQGPSDSDPLAQRTKAAWKAFNAPIILNTAWHGTIRSKSTLPTS